MRYLPVAGLDRDVSQIVLGSAALAGLAAHDAHALLDVWLDLGGNMIDTARLYDGGKSETVIGDWLEASGARDRMMILTKGCHFDADGDRVSKTELDGDLERSLKALKTDYIDLYLLHRDDTDIPAGDMVDWLAEHRASGRIRAFGGSNWSPDRVDEANAHAAKRGIPGFAAVSNYFGLAVANEPIWPGCEMMGDEHVKWHGRTGIPNFAWSSQAQGFFSGRFRPERVDDPHIARTFYSEENWRRLRRARDFGASLGKSATQIACAYVLNQAFRSFALVGPETVQELTSCAEAAYINLSADDLNLLAGVSN